MKRKIIDNSYLVEEDFLIAAALGKSIMNNNEFSVYKKDEEYHRISVQSKLVAGPRCQYNIPAFRGLFTSGCLL